MVSQIKTTNKMLYNVDKNPLFEYLKPYENNRLSDMSGSELQDFLYYLNKYKLQLRTKLGFSSKVTFGIEIEFEKTKGIIELKNKMEDENIDSDRWIPKLDGSLKQGIEIESPILRNSEKTWSELKKVCDIARCNGKILKNCGGHVHIGAHVLGDAPTSWLNFFKLWSVYENIIFRFGYGEYLTARNNILEYAEICFKELFEDYLELSEENCLNINDVLEALSFYERCNAVNFSNVNEPLKYSKDNTIEFRCPNGTLEPVIWQNYINLFVNLLLYSKCSAYNDEIILERKNKLHFQADKDVEWYLKLYNQIYLEQAIELADLIFDTNYDKIYFLRQYLKNYEISEKPFIKAKPFVKTLTKNS